jgi:hypothetical protein
MKFDCICVMQRMWQIKTMAQSRIYSLVHGHRNCAPAKMGNQYKDGGTILLQNVSVNLQNWAVHEQSRQWNGENFNVDYFKHAYSSYDFRIVSLPVHRLLCYAFLQLYEDLHVMLIAMSKKYEGSSESNASMFVSVPPDKASSGRPIVQIPNTNLKKLQPLTWRLDYGQWWNVVSSQNTNLRQWTMWHIILAWGKIIIILDVSSAFREWTRGFQELLKNRPSSLFMLLGWSSINLIYMIPLD